MAQELKAHCITTRSYNTCFCYDKDEVDAVLAAKDAFIKTLGEGQAELACEIERLKTKLEDVQASTNADEVIADLEDKLKVQTSIAEEAWKLEDVYRTSYAEAVKELYDKNKEIAELKDKLRSLLEHDKKEIKEAK